MCNDCGIYSSFELLLDYFDQLDHQIEMDAPDWIPAGSVITLDHANKFDEIGTIKPSGIWR